MDKKTLQNPISIDNQIYNLISKCLIIEDRDYAKSWTAIYAAIELFSLGMLSKIFGNLTSGYNKI